MRDFVPVHGFEGYYLVNKEGDVLSQYYGILLKHGEAAGYPKVTLYKPGVRGKTRHIHRLVAEHFIPNPDGLAQVNHKDGNPQNFSIENLEWCTSSENIKHSYRELGRGNGWGTTRPKVNRARVCESCHQKFMYKRKEQRFCSNKCATKKDIAIELFKQGVLKR